MSVRDEGGFSSVGLHDVRACCRSSVQVSIRASAHAHAACAPRAAPPPPSPPSARGHETLVRRLRSWRGTHGTRRRGKGLHGIRQRGQLASSCRVRLRQTIVLTDVRCVLCEPAHTRARGSVVGRRTRARACVHTRRRARQRQHHGGERPIEARARARSHAAARTPDDLRHVGHRDRLLPHLRERRLPQLHLRISGSQPLSAPRSRTATRTRPSRARAPHTRMHIDMRPRAPTRSPRAPHTRMHIDMRPRAPTRSPRAAARRSCPAAAAPPARPPAAAVFGYAHARLRECIPACTCRYRDSSSCPSSSSSLASPCAARRPATCAPAARMSL